LRAVQRILSKKLRPVYDAHLEEEQIQAH